MSYATPVDILHESPQVDDDFYKSNIDYENIVIQNNKRAAKGMVLGLVFSIPIWILIIRLID